MAATSSMPSWATARLAIRWMGHSHLRLLGVTVNINEAKTPLSKLVDQAAL